LFGLIELTTYGLKGLCAYFYHAEKLRGNNEEIYPSNERRNSIVEIMKLCVNLTEPNPTLEFLLGTALGCGKEGLTAMTWLDKGHTTNLGKPEPTEVPRTPVEGKAILVSGHDLTVL
jgi:hydroxylamine reductase